MLRGAILRFCSVEVSEAVRAAFPCQVVHEGHFAKAPRRAFEVIHNSTRSGVQGGSQYLSRRPGRSVIDVGSGLNACGVDRWTGEAYRRCGS